MPLWRYFVYVGGALLALLFLISAVLPTLPDNEMLATGSDRPVIRIRSERKLPERVVIDTTQPTITPTAAVMAQSVPAPPPPRMAAKARESFAQLVQPEPKGSSAVSKKAEARLRQGPKRRVARVVRPFGPPIMLMAQQPHFGPFNTFW